MALDLNEAGRLLVARLQARGYPGIKISFAAAPGHALIAAQPAEVQSVFYNFAIAAADALSIGDQLMVEISRVAVADAFAELCLGVPLGDYVALSIKDTGTGDESACPDQSAAYQAIARNGGAVSVHRIHGVGSVIRMMFAQAGIAELQKATPKCERLRPGTETILLVEDETAVRQFLRKLLIGQGYEVLDASTGGDAAMLASRFRGSIDLLLTDMALPGLSGTEIVARITALRPDIAVLCMSGQAGGFAGVTGADSACIQKPFKPDALLKRIRSLLDGQADYASRC